MGRGPAIPLGRAGLAKGRAGRSRDREGGRAGQAAGASETVNGSGKVGAMGWWWGVRCWAVGTPGGPRNAGDRDFRPCLRIPARDRLPRRGD